MLGRMIHKLVKHSILLTLGIIAAGCIQPGNALVRYERDANLARVSSTPQKGQYALYEEHQQNPDVTYTLPKDEKIGFIKGDDGKVYAVAGSHKDELKTRTTYFWRALDE